MDTTHDDEIAARLQVVAARAHRTLTSEEQAQVRERIKRDLALRDEMRTIPLGNGDSPDTGFLPVSAAIGGAPW